MKKKRRGWWGELDVYDYLAIAIVLLTFVSRIALSPHCLWIDEARELSIARNLLRTGKTTYLRSPWSQHPIMFYFLIALNFLLFGFTDFAGLLIPMTLGSLTVLLIYLIGAEMGNKKLGLIASLLLAFHPLFWFLSDRILNDVPVTFFITLSIYFFLKGEKDDKYMWLAGISSALAVLTKVVAISLFPFYLIYLTVKRREKFLFERKYWVAFGLFFLIFSSWMLKNYLDFGYFLPLELYIGRITAGQEVLDAQPPQYYLLNLPSILRWWLFLLFTWGLFCSYLRRFKDTFPFVLYALVFFIIISSQTVKVPRYLLPMLPPIVLVSAVGLDKLMRDFKTSGLLLVFTILLFVLYSSTSEATALIRSKAKGFCGLKDVGNWLKPVIGDKGIIAGSTMQIAWYADTNNVYGFPRNESSFDDFVKENNISFIVVDAWERTQPRYVYMPVEGGYAFWYPYFLNKSIYPVVQPIVFEDRVVAVIYGVES